jgi:hypothetical protein
LVATAVFAGQTRCGVVAAFAAAAFAGPTISVVVAISAEFFFFEYA